MTGRPIELSEHGIEEARRRGVAGELVLQVAAAPEQRELVRPDREVRQARVEIDGKEYLVRVFVDIKEACDVVVTVYRTSKVRKYWRSP